MSGDSSYRCGGLKGVIRVYMRCGGYREKKKEAQQPLRVYS